MERSFSAQLFEPAIGTDPLLSLETAAVARHREFQLGLMLDYRRDALVVSARALDPATGDRLSSGDPGELSLVENALTADLAAAFGLAYRWLRLELGFGLPVHLLMGGDELGANGQQVGALSASGIGDLRLHLKLSLFRDLGGFALALAPLVTLPTACASTTSCAEEGRFRGDGTATFRPRVVADFRRGPLLIAANVGWAFRRDAHVLSSTVGDQLLVGVGASHGVGRSLDLIAEVNGQLGITADDCRTVEGAEVCNDGSDGINRFPVEALLAGRVAFGNGFHATVGAGTGIVRGLGAPRFRLLAGLRWMPDFRDYDGDGILDRNDRCPTQPEDKDGFKDADGCPDPDNDEDLVLDVEDRCPNVPEDRDTFEDQDGCPELDNDKDGIEDRLDHCPFLPENKNGFEDQDGCPDSPDTDGDGIKDEQDACPKEPETINGLKDGDGCPDQGDLRFGEKTIELLRPLDFVGDEVAEASRPVLDQMAMALVRLPEIVRVEIGARVKRLPIKGGGAWDARISAVHWYLVDRGLPSERLQIAAPRVMARGETAPEGLTFTIVARRAGR